MMMIGQSYDNIASVDDEGDNKISLQTIMIMVMTAMIVLLIFVMVIAMMTIMITIKEIVENIS